MTGVTTMTVTTRRTFVGAAAALTVATVSPRLVVAHETHASPEAEGNTPLLGDLGLPGFTIVATDSGLQIPADLPTGTVLLTLDNQSATFASLAFVQLVEGATEDDLAAGLGEGGIPDFAHDSTMTGGVSAEPGQQGSVAFDLAAGDWFILNTGSEAATMDHVTISGEGETVDIPAAAAVEMHHHDFVIPDGIAVGPQVWKLTNVDPVLHHIVLLSYPEEVTEEDALALLMAQEGMGTPPPGLDPSQAGFLGESGLLSEGVTNWLEFDFQPATYIAVCFINDPGSEVPHVAEGMIEVFTVA
jgi:hypothetical protein